MLSTLYPWWAHFVQWYIVPLPYLLFQRILWWCQLKAHRKKSQKITQNTWCKASEQTRTPQGLTQRIQRLFFSLLFLSYIPPIQLFWLFASSKSGYRKACEYNLDSFHISSRQHINGYVIFLCLSFCRCNHRCIQLVLDELGKRDLSL